MYRPFFKKIIFLAVLAAVLFSGQISLAAQDKNKACINGYCFSVEVARTPDELMAGLQFRDSMDKDAGMLFIFPQLSIQSFWMKDTSIPLDIIWIDSSFRVAYIEKNAPPCRQEQCPTYTPLIPALYVLEINAGLSEEFGIQLGQEIKFQLQEK